MQADGADLYLWRVIIFKSWWQALGRSRCLNYLNHPCKRLKSRWEALGRLCRLQLLVPLIWAGSCSWSCKVLKAWRRAHCPCGCFLFCAFRAQVHSCMEGLHNLHSDRNESQHFDPPVSMLAAAIAIKNAFFEQKQPQATSTELSRQIINLQKAVSSCPNVCCCSHSDHLCKQEMLLRFSRCRMPKWAGGMVRLSF